MRCYTFPLIVVAFILLCSSAAFADYSTSLAHVWQLNYTSPGIKDYVDKVGGLSISVDTSARNLSGFYPAGSLIPMINGTLSYYLQMPAFDIPSSRTLCVWIIWNGTENRNFIRYSPAGDNDLLWLATAATGNLIWKSCPNDVNSGTVGPKNVWFFMCQVANSTGNYGYYNGVLNGSQAGSECTGTATYAFTLGDPSGVNSAEAGFDEIMLWNRSLSHAEILDLYNGGSGKFYPAWGGAASGTIAVALSNITSSQYPIYVNSSLQSFCNSTSSVSGQTLNVSYRLFRNSSAVDSGSVNVTESILTSILNKTGLAKGDSFKFECQPSNASVNGSAVNSSAVSVANFPITIGSVTLNQSNATLADYVRCNNASVVDIDNDTVTRQFLWFRNGTTTNLTLQDLPISGVAVKGDTLFCRENASDGSSNSTGYSSNISILNSAPVISSPNTFLNASDGHSFQVWANVTDLDLGSDIIKVNVSTSSGSCVYKSNSSSGNMFGSRWNCSGTVGQLVNVSLYFEDASGSGVWSSNSSNQFPNQLPLINITQPSEGASYSVNHVIFNWTGSDADGDGLSYSLYLGTSPSSMTLQYAGTANTYSVDGLNNGTYYWNLSSSDGYALIWNATRNFSVLPPQLRINASNQAGAAIAAFVMNLSSASEAISGSTSSSVLYLNTSYSLYSYTATASGYGILSGSILMNGNVNLTLGFIKTSAANINVYHDANGSLASGPTISLKFISSSYATNATTTTGTYYIDYLPSSNYTLEYGADGFHTQRYYFTITTTTSADIKLYLIANSSNIEPVTITLYNTLGEILKDYDIVAQKYSASTANYEFNQMGRTDDTGTTNLYFDLLANWYKFLVQKNGITYKSTNPQQVYGGFSIIVDVNPASSSPYDRLAGVNYNLSYVNASGGYFLYSFSDQNNLVTQSCLQVFTPLQQVSFCSECLNTSSGSITCAVNSSNASSLIARASVVLNGATYYLTSLDVDWNVDYQLSGAFGAFVGALLLIGVGLLGVASPAVSIIFSSVVLILIAALGFWPLAYSGAVLILIIGFVGILLVSRRPV